MKLLREVEGGARVRITKDGRPVAVLVPAKGDDSDTREAARWRVLDLRADGLPIGFDGQLDRDELHRR